MTDSKKSGGIGELKSILLFTFLTLLTIFLPKTLNPSCGIQKFLFPGEVRMAAGTNLYPYLLLGARRLEGCSASTFDQRIKNFGVNVLFHLLSLHKYFTDFSRIFNSFPSSEPSHVLAFSLPLLADLY